MYSSDPFQVVFVPHSHKDFYILSVLYIVRLFSIFPITEEPNTRDQYVAMEMNYDLCCQSDPLRLLRNSKVFTSVYNPTTEKTVAILLSDSRLILWDVLSRDVKV